MRLALTVVEDGLFADGPGELGGHFPPVILRKDPVAQGVPPPLVVGQPVAMLAYVQAEFGHGDAEVGGGVPGTDPEALVVDADGDFVNGDAQEEGCLVGVAVGGPANELDGRITADEPLIEGDAGGPDEAVVPVLFQERRNVVGCEPWAARDEPVNSGRSGVNQRLQDLAQLLRAGALVSGEEAEPGHAAVVGVEGDLEQTHDPLLGVRGEQQRVGNPISAPQTAASAGAVFIRLTQLCLSAEEFLPAQKYAFTESRRSDSSK
ncbi:hypothetical protein [Streptomyces lushanensis]|uniref:hypothetical protein n=1 Tax=Streptomyces lushanensis TaxID=1434255 RepID=UPI000836710A|nr:hypothetical protein [Streptomyces lushanensis]